MRKTAPLLLIVVLAVLLLIIRQCKFEEKQDPSNTKTKKRERSEASTVNRDRGFDRRISYLQYSNHAKCRMQCRKITQAEVEEIMQDGKINYNKSDIRNSRCPRYALEGLTRDDQRVRIVFAQCNEKTEVVTVIDMDTDWSCNCPGDDKK
jgi:hypothetical protein